MKRNFLLALVIIFALTMMIACGGGQQPVVRTDSGDVVDPADDMVVIEDPFQDLQDMSATIIDDGGVAAVGTGTSKRRDLAQKKARTDAVGQLSEIFNQKVNRLRKMFSEEIGSGDDTEINEAFSEVTKIVTSQQINGAVPKKTKYTRSKSTGMYTAAVLVAIEPNKINMSILDEMQNKKPKLYERFRATQAYEELKEEIEDYEKKQGM